MVRAIDLTDAPDEAADEDLKVVFMVVWAPHHLDTLASNLLLTAFGAYAELDLKRALLEAHSAVDVALRGLMNHQLIPAWKGKFPSLGFDQRLLVLTAALRGCDIEPLPSTVVSALIELKDERNRAAHGSNVLVEDKKAAWLICNALAALACLRHIEARPRHASHH